MATLMSIIAGSRTLAVLYCLGVAEGLVAQAPPRTFTPATEPLSSLVDDATRLGQASAEARFDALIALLDERDLLYEIQPFSNPRADEVGPAEGRNVVVTIGTGDRDLIVGAHADAAVLEDGSLSHAMVDNAAAVTVLVRVSEALQRVELAHRVRVLFFDLEELNLLGSRHFVETVDRDRIVGMINLDITGYGDTLVYGPAAGDGNEPLYGAIQRMCGDAGHQCLEFDRFPPGDDRSFQAAGIPNVSLATLPRLEAHQFWLMLNGESDGSGLRDGFAPHILQTIHTADDTADKLDPAGMTLAYNVVMGLVLELDRTP